MENKEQTPSFVRGLANVVIFDPDSGNLSEPKTGKRSSRA
jgi:hypothetical protein